MNQTSPERAIRRRRILVAVSLIIAAAFIVIVLGLRPFWKDIRVFLGTGFPVMEAALTAGFAALLFNIAVLRRRISIERRWVTITAPAVAVVMLVLLAVLFANLGRGAGIILSEMREHGAFAAAAAAVFVALYFFPVSPFSQRRYVRPALSVLGVLVLIAAFFDIRPMRLVSPPVVFVRDGGRLAVVWETNRRAVSRVEYGADRDLGRHAGSSTAGLLDLGDNLQMAVLPAAGVRSDSLYFQAASLSVRRVFQTNASFGREVRSEIGRLSPDDDPAAFTFLSFSDIHEKPALYRHMIAGEDPGTCDVIVLNGDLTDDLRRTSQISAHILNLDAVPFPVPRIFVRGNHEARGEAARELKEALVPAGEEFYFSYTEGDTFIVVLDSGEDKEDGHPEFSGLVDFESYHRKQTAWLEQVIQEPEFNAARRRVVFVHIPPIPEYTSPYMDGMYRLLNDAGIDLLVAGHTHEAEVLPPGESGWSFPVVISGGYPAGKSAYVRGSLGAEGVEAEVVDYHGTVVASYRAD